MLLVPAGRMLPAFCWTVECDGVNKKWTELAVASIAARLPIDMTPPAPRKKLGRG